MWRPGPENQGWKRRYLDAWFIFIQDMVERALVEELSQSRVATPGVYLHQMPYPCYNQDKSALPPLLSLSPSSPFSPSFPFTPSHLSFLSLPPLLSLPPSSPFSTSSPSHLSFFYFLSFLSLPSLLSLPPTTLSFTLSNFLLPPTDTLGPWYGCYLLR